MPTGPGPSSERSHCEEEPALERRAAPLAVTRESSRRSEDPVQKKKKRKTSHDEWKIKILKKDWVKSSVKVSHELKELIIVIVH